MKTTLLLALSATFVLGGCVSKGKYDQAVAVTETTRAELQKKTDLLAQTSAELEGRKNDVAKEKAEIARLAELDRMHAGENRGRIRELTRRLVELENAERVAEWRAATYRELTLKLKKQIDDGDLEIVIRDGRMVLALPNDVLFDTGRTELKSAGKSALEAVATVIASMPDRHFQISGHTDNIPIHTDHFASN